ncbi:hypothetical protein BDF20DRAFT_911943 [Mycotypha africana]|uniref:uncharacterized protein n=1 Tax=Mycotypha africana TaxID=64632 RepID=UPI0023012B21|nr:uncharacterized protein BDF20DRAFT_911943 [Mycotypha africana]KAI8981679.1 hypothetical protein BDF20DRAFT_911943 [Mycotypha africana]
MSVYTKEPYLIQEKGWGEFDMRVVLYFTNNLAEPENILFDLHFRDHTYTIMHRIVFTNPSTELLRLLTIEIPDSSSTSNTHHDGSSSKKRRASPSSSTSYSGSTTGAVANKKIKTPPGASSPALYNNDGATALTPITFNYTVNNKYPASLAAAASPSTTSNSHIHFLNEYSNESDDLYRGMHGYRLTKKTALQDGVIVDEIYSTEDLDKVNAIHYKGKEEPIRSAWGLPEGVDILELAKRLSMSSPEQIEEIRYIVTNHKRHDTLFEENDEEFMLDLYSLGPELLNILWDFTEKKTDSSTKSSMILSPFSMAQATSSSTLTDDDHQTPP